MKGFTDKQKRQKKARLWLNKYCKLGWGLKWKNTDKEVKSLSRIIKP